MERVQEAIAKARSKRQGAISELSIDGASAQQGAAPSDLPRQADAATEAGQLAETPAETPIAVGASSAAPAGANDGPTGVNDGKGARGVNDGNDAKGVNSGSGRQGLDSLHGINYTRTRVEPAAEQLLAANRVIAGLRGDARVDVYRQLRSKLLIQMKANNWNTLAITSPTDGAGKTLTAVNLAISLSQEVNQTVMLVDLDLRSPSVHRTLGLPVDKGLPDYLLGDEPVENLLVNPGFSRLVILPGKEVGDHSSELLTSPRMRALLHEIINRYSSRIIIFDLPPLLRNDDALVFTPQVDATLMVVEDGVNTPEQVQRCQQLLEQNNLIGTVLNKAKQ